VTHFLRVFIHFGVGVGLSVAIAIGQTGTPSITSIANAASLTPAPLPAGGLAQGGIFSIIGAGLGPGDPTDPTTGTNGTVPYAMSLGGVSVQITQGATTICAYPVFVWANRVDAILPSGAPLGAVTITLTYNGVASGPASATVVTTNFGAYSTHALSGGRGVIFEQSSPTDPGVQNSTQVTAMPGQMVTMIGTGLGPISGPDNDVPPAGDLPVSLQVLVGGAATTPLHADRVPNQPGEDQIQFIVPAGAPAGCNTPVLVVTGGSIYSNVVTLSIDPNGQPCSTINPWTSLADQGGPIGNIFLLRSNASVLVQAGQPPVNVLLDQGLAVFSNSPAGGGPLLSLLASIPTLGTCGALSGMLNFISLLGGTTAALPGASEISFLDAGTSITILGPGGIGQLTLGTNADGTPVAPPAAYSATFGGGLGALFGLPVPSPFLQPGLYRIFGSGGADVGSFTTTLTIPQPVTWSNQAAVSSIDRTAGVTLNWQGGTSSQLVMAAGIASDPATNATTGFVCLVPATEGSFAVPVSAVANLPAAGPAGSPGILGVLLVGTVPAGPAANFIAGGLDAGLVVYGNFEVQRVAIQ
jgi:uncharacterized protein (TIGR03437 family)